MNAVNTVAAGPYNFVVKGKQRPFSNNFVVQSAEVVQYEGKDEIYAVVICTDNSKEPGRKYACNFSITGRLETCNTLN